ncbi:MAG: hypothetical protein WBQ94_04425 [Terracidiphilus sp.]
MRLLSKQDWRAALADEGIPDRPEVTIIIKPLAFARFREGWTGTASGPDGPVVGPSGLTEGETPEASPGEEVALGISHKVGWFDVCDAALIHISRRDRARLDGFPYYFRFEWVDFVVVGANHRALPATSAW